MVVAASHKAGEYSHAHHVDDYLAPGAMTNVAKKVSRLAHLFKRRLRLVCQGLVAGSQNDQLPVCRGFLATGHRRLEKAPAPRSDEFAYALRRLHVYGGHIYICSCTAGCRGFSHAIKNPTLARDKG